jgi:hypothetical protein
MLIRKPVDWRQLCAIARDQIQADPAIDNFEWKELIKIRLLAIGLTYPVEPNGIDRAMRAVERALSRDWGPRPTSPSTPPPAPTEPDRPLNREEAAAILADLGVVVPAIPKARATPRRVVTVHRASAAIAAEIVASIQRCEEAERAAADAAAAVEPEPAEPTT